MKKVYILTEHIFRIVGSGNIDHAPKAFSTLEKAQKAYDKWIAKNPDRHSASILELIIDKETV